MGVEQVFVDYFQRAKEYQQEWKAYNALPRKVKARTTAPRYDLEMETLVEILNGERFISCHSYVQSEINMLMKVAERFGVTINTFTHILEGYKVADKMKRTEWAVLPSPTGGRTNMKYTTLFHSTVPSCTAKALP